MSYFWDFVSIAFVIYITVYPAIKSMDKNEKV